MFNIEDAGNVFSRFYEETGIRVSPTAQRLILSILDAIYEDPHPAWPISGREANDRAQRLEFANSQFENLPGYLASIAEEESLFSVERTNMRMITSFSVLHWLGRNIDSICPIEK